MCYEFLLATIWKFLPLALVVTVACDPGMTIHQVVRSEPSRTSEQMSVHVNASNLLIGEKHYAPRVETTNLSSSAITVTGVDVVAHGVVFQGTWREPQNHSLIIASGETQSLKLWFELAQSVQKTFDETIEMRITYRSGGAEQVTKIALVGGPLQKIPTKKSSP